MLFSSVVVLSVLSKRLVNFYSLKRYYLLPEVYRICFMNDKITVEIACGRNSFVFYQQSECGYSGE